MAAKTIKITPKEPSLPVSGLILLGALLFSGCSRPPMQSRPVFPDTVTPLVDIPMAGLADDHLFFGDWGGPMFDKTDYRPLHGKGGGILFRTSETGPLIGSIVLKAEGETELSVLCNGDPVKTELIPKNERHRVGFMIAANRLAEGENRLELQKTEPGALLRIESIRLLPRRLVNRSIPSEEMALPARFSFSVMPGEGEKLLVNGRKAIDRIRITIQGSSGPVLQEERENPGEWLLDLPSSPQEPLQVEIRCSGRELTLPRPQIELLTPQEDHRTQEIRGAAERLASLPQRPNVLVILLDSARADHFGAYGSPRPTTPNLDRLASRSLRFQHFSCEAAYTLASTATLMTGLAPDSHNVLSDYYGGMSDRLLTLAEQYREQGYFCAAVSAIPYCGKSFSMDQGFQEFEELFQRNPQVMAPEFVPELERLLGKSRERSKPFFIYLHIREPHIDFRMPPPFYKKFRRTFLDLPDEQFAGFIHDLYFGKGPWSGRKPDPDELQLLRDSYDENLLSADDAVGKLLLTLERSGLADNTLIAVLGDHGEGLGEHGLIGHNVVLYREGVRIPLILHHPGMTDQALVSDLSFSTSDLSRTLAALAAQDEEKIRESGIFAREGRRVKVTRSIFFNRYYPHYLVEEGPFRAHLDLPWDKGERKVFRIDRDPDEQTPLRDERLLNHFAFQLRQHLRLCFLSRSIAGKSSPSETEVKALRSLGYL